MGSATEPAAPALAALCRPLGRIVAECGCCLLTGASPGLPHEAVLGAREVGGHIVGISPAATLREHVDVLGSPYRDYDVLIFTGLGLIGVLTGTGGITEALREVEASLRKETGAEVLYEADPVRLVDRLLELYGSGSYVCPCRPGGSA
jgi:hypothetical protein